MIVLDTHAWIWWASDPGKLSSAARSAIDYSKSAGICPISCWEDLSRDANLESPAWHEEVLVERDQQVEAGEAHFMDWEQAKAEIRLRLS